MKKHVQMCNMDLNMKIDMYRDLTGTGTLTQTRTQIYVDTNMNKMYTRGGGGQPLHTHSIKKASKIIPPPCIPVQCIATCLCMPA
jgi:hypothetical protein